MRLLLLSFLALVAVVSAVCASGARAQSISQNLPGGGYDNGSVYVAPDVPPAAASTPAVPAGDPYTVADVNADVTADNANHARDQALMQAERAAFVQLCARLNAPDSASKMSDDAIAALVQSFEVQSEHLSAVRYIGVFTIRFKPAGLQKKLGRYLAAAADANGVAPVAGEGKAAPLGPISHLMVSVQTDSLAAWAQMKRRLNSVPQVARVDTIDLGRGVSHIDLLYGGTLDELRDAVTGQGFVLRQDEMGQWEMTDGSMVPR